MGQLNLTEAAIYACIYNLVLGLRIFILPSRSVILRRASISPPLEDVIYWRRCSKLHCYIGLYLLSTRYMRGTFFNQIISRKRVNQAGSYFLRML